MSANLDSTSKQRRASFDDLRNLAIGEKAKTDINSKPRFLQRVFKRKYGKLKKSKSNEDLSEALNISVDDVENKKTRASCGKKPADSWAVNEEKNKRRGAVCEENEDKREEFTKILEKFIIRKNMDDYGY